MLAFAAFIFGVRLITLGLYPLMDTTEARYGEIARVMVETGDWLTPRIDAATPFWGKPPLYAWLSAGSIAIFGNSEFALRLPHWIAGVATLWLTWLLARSAGLTRERCALAVAVLASTAVFIIASGIIMTDMVLCLSITAAMFAFWRTWQGQRRWQWLFFAALGIGLLAKGPVVIALAATALVPWLAITEGPVRMWVLLCKRSSLFLGSLLTLAIALPWYLLAEHATPGFLNYFIAGEHWNRFFVSGWSGDLYGVAHSEPKGTIWWFWLLACLPWSPIALWMMLRRTRAQWSRRRDWSLYLVMWIASPALLFTFAGNVLLSYVLPGVPALALLIAELADEPSRRTWKWGLAPWPVLLLIAAVTFGGPAADGRSDKGLLSRGVFDDAPIYYSTEVPYSAMYYSGGAARHNPATRAAHPHYLVIPREQPAGNAPCSFRSANAKRALFYCP